MEALTIKAYAKINLCLNITALRKDGYHELDSVFQSIGLFDSIHLKKAEGIKLSCDDKSIPVDSTNTCYKAAFLVMQKIGVPGVSVAIEKRIPSQAGLGGGSADAAAVIAGMNQMYQCGLSDQEMTKMAVTIGADVPFFIKGGCMRAQGIGEQLTALSNPFLHDVVVIKPKGGVSTPASYRLFDQSGTMGGSAERMIDAMADKDEAAYLGAVANALASCAYQIVPDSLRAVDALKHLGAMAAEVTVSGSAVFGLFKPGAGETAKEKLEFMDFEQVFLTEVITNR